MTSPSTNTEHQTVIACIHCDQLQAYQEPAPGHHLRCVNCNSIIELGGNHSTRIAAGLVITGLLFFLPALFMPIMSLDLISTIKYSSVFGGITYLVEQAQYFTAGLVFFCTIFAPALVLIAFAVILFAPHTEKMHRYKLSLAYLLCIVRGWAMLDVYILGYFVSVIKLRDFGPWAPEPGFYCLVGLAICLLKLFADHDANGIWKLTECHQRECP